MTKDAQIWIIELISLIGTDVQQKEAGAKRTMNWREGGETESPCGRRDRYLSEMIDAIANDSTVAKSPTIKQRTHQPGLAVFL